MGELKTLEELEEISSSYFTESNSAVYVTTDGTPFLDGSESYAHSHARQNNLGVAKFIKEGDSIRCVTKPLDDKGREWEDKREEPEPTAIILEDETETPIITLEPVLEPTAGLTDDQTGESTGSDNSNAPEPVSGENKGRKK
jgi:hypothetical protein